MSSWGYRSVPPDPRVRLTLTLEVTQVKQGDYIPGKLKMENTSLDFVDITHPTSCVWDVAVYDRYGNYAGGSEGRVCGEAVTRDEMKPLEVRNQSFSRLDTLGKGREENRKPLPLGTYQVAAGVEVIHCPGGNHPDSEHQYSDNCFRAIWFAAPVRIDIVP